MPFGHVVEYDSKAGKPLQEKTTIKVDKPDSGTSHHPDDKTQNNYGGVQPTLIESKANMEIVHREVRFLLPSTGKLRISAHEYVVNVPCCQNCKAIKKNDELTYFAPKVKKENVPEKRDAPELQLVAPVTNTAKR